MITQSLLPRFSQPGVLFDVILHAGSLLAVVVFYYKTILKLTRNYWVLIGLGTIPAVLVGYFLGDFIEPLFSSTKVVGVALLVTAFFNFQTDRNIDSSKDTSFVRVRIDKVSSWTSTLIGIFQSFAIIPGVSRSGSTIFAGTKRGLSAEDAAQFSFLLSIPAILGASFLQVIKYSEDVAIDPVFYVLGFVSAFIAGMLAIGWVIQLLKAKKFKYFSYYSLALGVGVLLFL